MKSWTAQITLAAALLAAFAVGCSKSPQKSSSPAPANRKDLGVVELTEGTPQHFSLGDGKGCTLTGKQLPKGVIEVSFMIESTNAGGTVDVLSRPRLSTSPGQQCVISVGDVSIGLTPKWKTP